MLHGQGKPGQLNEVTRWLEMGRTHDRRVVLTLHSGEGQASVSVSMEHHRQAAEFASLLAEIGELVLVSDHPMHMGKL